jgi:hypothetical protein
LNVFSDRERQTLNVLKNARAINADADMILPSRAAINAAVAAGVRTARLDEGSL